MPPVKFPDAYRKALNYVYDVATDTWVPSEKSDASYTGGDASAANQTSEIAALGAQADTAWVSGNGTIIAILKKIASAGGSAVSLSDGADVAQGTTTDVEAAGNGTVIAILKKIRSLLSTTLAVTGTGGTFPVTGTFYPTAAASPLSARLSDGSAFYKGTTPSDTQLVSGSFYQATQPVSGAFYQATQPVSLASLPAVTGTVTSNAGTNLNTSLLALETGGNLAAIKADVDKIPSQGQALASASVPVVLTALQATALTPPAAITGFLSEADFDTKSGSLTEGAPATDTASSGLNGRLQRIAQRLSSLIALVPTALSNGFFQVSLKETITVPASQSGTWTVQPGNTANTTAWKVDGSAVTQPVSGTFYPATQPVSIASMPSTPVTGTFWQTTQPVSGTLAVNAGTNLNTSALALETGGNLAAIKADVDKIPAQGQALAAGSTPVVLTAIQVTALTPPAAIAGFALEAGHLATIDTSTAKIPAQGQALAAASLPVVLTALQVTALTPPAAITGFALETTQVAEAALVGAVTEGAPATDTASSGLNGRLQRVAQRLSSLIALVPTTLSNGFFQVSLKETVSVPVTGTFYQGTQPVSGTFYQGTQPVSIAAMPSTPVTNVGVFATQDTEARPSAATLTLADWTAVSDTTRALTLIAANAARRGLSIRNDTDTKILVREGGTAGPNAYTDILYPGDEYVSDYPVCTALLSAYIPTIPQGSMFITERA